MTNTELHELIDQLNAKWFDPAAGTRVLINPDGRKASLALSQLIERNEVLEERLLEAEVRAHGWMKAHDCLKAGKPYKFPSPADLPDLRTALSASLE